MYTPHSKMELKQRTRLSMIALVSETIGLDIHNYYAHTHKYDCFNSLCLRY